MATSKKTSRNVSKVASTKQQKMIASKKGFRLSRKQKIITSVVAALVLVGGGYATYQLNQNYRFDALYMPSACSSEVSKWLYQTKYFYNGTVQMLGGSVKVYATYRNKGEYCIRASVSQGRLITSAGQSGYKRASTTSPWVYLGASGGDIATLSHSRSVTMTSKLKSMRLWYDARGTDGRSYTATTSYLTLR